LISILYFFAAFSIFSTASFIFIAASFMLESSLFIEYFPAAIYLTSIPFMSSNNSLIKVSPLGLVVVSLSSFFNTTVFFF